MKYDTDYFAKVGSRRGEVADLQKRLRQRTTSTVDFTEELPAVWAKLDARNSRADLMSVAIKLGCNKVAS